MALTSFGQGAKNLHLLSSTNVGQTMAGCWHYNHASGKEYALLGAADGIMIYDITNPVTPIFITQLPGVNSLWHEVKVLGDYAYAVSEGQDPADTLNGLQIIDLRNLPSQYPYKFYRGDSTVTEVLRRAHTVTAEGHYVYVNGHNMTTLNRGILIFDVSDPWNPVYVSAITDNYCHDSFVRGTRLFSSEIGAGQFVEFDISDPANPVIVATQATPGLFNHNAWLSDDSNILYTTDEKQNQPLGSYDVSNSGNITLLDTFFNGNFTANEVHNVRVFNDFLLCPSYGSQLTIVDAARPHNLIEVGNFTTGSSLCWDADPYTNSGNVIATDMNDQTFYIFEPTYTRACYLEGTVVDSVTGQLLINVNISFTSLGINTTSNLSGEFYTGYADGGTYSVSFSKAGYIPKTLTVSLSNGNLTTLNVELVPIGAGVSQLAVEELTVFPNPAVDQFTITSKFSNFNYQLIDGLGKIILSGNSATAEKVVDTKNLSSGSYTLQIVSDEQTIKRKVIVEHGK